MTRNGGGDDETVLLLRTRKEEGLRRLLTEHAPRVAGALYREFSELDRTGIDEVISSAAHLAWRSIDSFDAARGSLRTWLYVIARRCAVRIAARDRRQRPPGTVFDVDAVVLPANGAHSSVWSPWRAAVRALVADLPPLQRAIVEADLAAGGPADSGELAREHETTRNTIYAARSQARKSLRQALEQLGFGAERRPAHGH